jgi:hypothetical protein
LDRAWGIRPHEIQLGGKMLLREDQRSPGSLPYFWEIQVLRVRTRSFVEDIEQPASST